MQTYDQVQVCAFRPWQEGTIRKEVRHGDEPKKMDDDRGMREAGSYDRHWCTVYGSRSFMVVLTFFFQSKNHGA